MKLEYTNTYITTEIMTLGMENTEKIAMPATHFLIQLLQPGMILTHRIHCKEFGFGKFFLNIEKIMKILRLFNLINNKLRRKQLLN